MRSRADLEVIKNFIDSAYNRTQNKLLVNTEKLYDPEHTELGYCYKHVDPVSGAVTYKIECSRIGIERTDFRILMHEYGHIYKGHLDGEWEEADTMVCNAIRDHGDEIIELIVTKTGLDEETAVKFLERVIDDPELNHRLHNIAGDMEVNSSMLSKEDVEEMEWDITGVLPEYEEEYLKNAINNTTNPEIRNELSERIRQMQAHAKLKLILPCRFYMGLDENCNPIPFPDDLTYLDYLLLIITHIDQFVKMMVSIDMGGNGDTSQVTESDVQASLNGVLSKMRERFEQNQSPEYQAGYRQALQDKKNGKLNPGNKQGNQQGQNQNPEFNKGFADGFKDKAEEMLGSEDYKEGFQDGQADGQKNSDKSEEYKDGYQAGRADSFYGHESRLDELSNNDKVPEDVKTGYKDGYEAQEKRNQTSNCQQPKNEDQNQQNPSNGMGQSDSNSQDSQNPQSQGQGQSQQGPQNQQGQQSQAQGQPGQPQSQSGQQQGPQGQSGQQGQQSQSQQGNSSSPQQSNNGADSKEMRDYQNGYEAGQRAAERQQQAQNQQGQQSQSQSGQQQGPQGQSGQQGQQSQSQSGQQQSQGQQGPQGQQGNMPGSMQMGGNQPGQQGQNQSGQGNTPGNKSNGSQVGQSGNAQGGSGLGQDNQEATDTGEGEGTGNQDYQNGYEAGQKAAENVMNQMQNGQNGQPGQQGQQGQGSGQMSSQGLQDYQQGYQDAISDLQQGQGKGGQQGLSNLMRSLGLTQQGQGQGQDGPDGMGGGNGTQIHNKLDPGQSKGHGQEQKDIESQHKGLGRCQDFDMDGKSDSRDKADKLRKEGKIQAGGGTGCGKGGSADLTRETVKEVDDVDMALGEVINDVHHRVIKQRLRRDVMKNYNRGINRSVIQPGIERKISVTTNPKVVYLIDISGSMDTRLVDRCLKTIGKEMCRINRDLRYDIITWSTHLGEHIKEINPKKGVPRISCGGGTDIAGGIEYFKQNYKDDAILVIISDFEDDLDEWHKVESTMTGYSIWGFNYGSGRYSRKDGGWTWKNLKQRNFSNYGYDD